MRVCVSIEDHRSNSAASPQHLLKLHRCSRHRLFVYVIKKTMPVNCTKNNGCSGERRLYQNERSATHVAAAAAAAGVWTVYGCCLESAMSATTHAESPRPSTLGRTPIFAPCSQLGADLTTTMPSHGDDRELSTMRPGCLVIELPRIRSATATATTSNCRLSHHEIESSQCPRRDGRDNDRHRSPDVGANFDNGDRWLSSPPREYYVTRHRLMTSDFDRVCNETVIGVCFPCSRGCRPPARRRAAMTAAEAAAAARGSIGGGVDNERRGPCSPRYFCWQTIRSEAFLFTLQVASMLLGVRKDIGTLETDSPELHATYSALELTGASLLIIVRTSSLRRKLNRLDERFRLLHRSTPDFRSTPKYRAVRRWVALHTGLGSFLFFVNAVFFAVFWHMDWKDWIVLTNNLCMSIITISTGIWTSRFNVSVFRLREDQHKVVLHDAVVLIDRLVDGDCDASPLAAVVDRWPKFHRRHLQVRSYDLADVSAAKRFTAAMRSETTFARPEHIVLDVADDLLMLTSLCYDAE